MCQEHDMQCKPVLMPRDDCDSQSRVCFARVVSNAWETALISLIGIGISIMKHGYRQWCGGSCTNCKSKASILGILRVEGELTFRTVIGRALLAMRVAVRRAKLIMRRTFPFSSCTGEVHTLAAQHRFCNIPEACISVSGNCKSTICKTLGAALILMYTLMEVRPISTQ